MLFTINFKSLLNINLNNKMYLCKIAVRRQTGSKYQMVVSPFLPVKTFAGQRYTDRGNTLGRDEYCEKES